MVWSERWQFGLVSPRPPTGRTKARKGGRRRRRRRRRRAGGAVYKQPRGQGLKTRCPRCCCCCCRGLLPSLPPEEGRQTHARAASEKTRARRMHAPVRPFLPPPPPRTGPGRCTRTSTHWSHHSPPPSLPPLPPPPLPPPLPRGKGKGRCSCLEECFCGARTDARQGRRKGGRRRREGVAFWVSSSGACLCVNIV